MLFASFKNKMVVEVLPKAVESLEKCDGAQDAIDWKSALLRKLAEVTVEGEQQPQDDDLSFVYKMVDTYKGIKQSMSAKRKEVDAKVKVIQKVIEDFKLITE